MPSVGSGVLAQLNTLDFFLFVTTRTALGPGTKPKETTKGEVYRPRGLTELVGRVNTALSFPHRPYRTGRSTAGTSKLGYLPPPEVSWTDSLTIAVLNVPYLTLEAAIQAITEELNFPLDSSQHRRLSIVPKGSSRTWGGHTYSLLSVQGRINGNEIGRRLPYQQ
jgi:hypothetical protein